MFCLFIFSCYNIFYRHTNSGGINMNSKKWTLGLFLFYVAALSWIVLFKTHFSLPDVQMRSINLIPFGASVIVNGSLDFSEIILNFLAFIPYGVFLSILLEKKPVLFQLMPVVCTSLLFEILQYALAIGASDITDVISNSLGGLSGILFAFALAKLSPGRWIKIINIVSLTGAFLLSLLICLLLFVNY